MLIYCQQQSYRHARNISTTFMSCLCVITKYPRIELKLNIGNEDRHGQRARNIICTSTVSTLQSFFLWAVVYPVSI